MEDNEKLLMATADESSALTLPTKPKVLDEISPIACRSDSEIKNGPIKIIDLVSSSQDDASEKTMSDPLDKFLPLSSSVAPEMDVEELESVHESGIVKEVPSHDEHEQKTSISEAFPPSKGVETNDEEMKEACSSPKEQIIQDFQNDAKSLTNTDEMIFRLLEDDVDDEETDDASVTLELENDSISNDPYPPMPRLTPKPAGEDAWDVEYLEDDSNTKTSELNEETLTAPNGRRKQILKCKDTPPEEEPSRDVFIFPPRAKWERRIKFRRPEPIFITDNKPYSLRKNITRPPLEQVALNGGKVESKDEKGGIESETDKSKMLENEQPQDSDEALEILPLKNLAGMLKEVIKQPWTVNLEGKGLYVVLEGAKKESEIQILITEKGKLSVSVRGQKLNKNHYLWKFLGETALYKDHFRIVFILQLLDWLRPFRVCEKAPHKDCDMFVLPPKLRCYKEQRKRKLHEVLPEHVKSEDKKDKKMPGNDLTELFFSLRDQLDVEYEKFGIAIPGNRLLVTQDEVLGSFGLRRRDSTDRILRKSKREKKTSAIAEGERVGRQEELNFLKKNWDDVTALFSESLHFGTYSCMGHKKLVDGLEKTHQLLSRWHRITEENPGFLSDINILFSEPSDVQKRSLEELRCALSTGVRDINKLRRKFKTVCPMFNKLLRKLLAKRSHDGFDTLIHGVVE